MQQINQGLRGRVEEGNRVDLRKIDSLVAEKVMGFEVTRDGEIRQDGKRFGIPSYCRKIEHAWRVVEKLNEKFTVDIRDTLNDGAECYLYEFQEETETLFPYTAADGETAPLAICLAALKAVGVEVEVDG